MGDITTKTKVEPQAAHHKIQHIANTEQTTKNINTIGPTKQHTTQNITERRTCVQKCCRKQPKKMIYVTNYIPISKTNVIDDQNTLQPATSRLTPRSNKSSSYSNISLPAEPCRKNILSTATSIQDALYRPLSQSAGGLLCTHPVKE